MRKLKCCNCKETKNEDEFYSKPSNRIRKRYSKCKQCCIEYRKNTYDKTKCRQWNGKNRIKLAKHVDELKVKPCMDCGQIYEPFCMDFDHISDDKIAPISLMVHNTWSVENIEKEIAKTELVCVLCHRTRTYLRQPRSSNHIIMRNYDFINSLKPSHCPVCGHQRESWHMDFDHISGNKRTPVTRLASSRYSINTIKKEIEKCQIICALCHRRKTFKEGDYRKWSHLNS